MHREEEGSGSPDQARRTAGPCGELAESLDGRREAGHPVQLDGRPDLCDDRDRRPHAQELPGQSFERV